MKIYDCFMYFDEELILDLRLNILDKFVDYFVIVESIFTHKGEKRDLKYNQNSFAKLISKYSNTQVININNELDLKKYLQKNIYNNEIVIGMGAGSISKWLRDLEKSL